MKKVFIAFALVASLMAVSCKNNEENETVANDTTVQVDSAAVDSAAVADTVCAE